MKKKIIVLLLLCGNSVFSLPPGQWKCFAFDYDRKSYQGMGKSARLAMIDARKNCLAHTTNKQHCKTAQSFCEQADPAFGSDRCVAVDGSGKAFNATGPEACDVAMTICDEWQFMHGNSQRRHCHIVHN
ncbi:MAG: hypothetical protein JJT82_10040 [Legionellaceae bacterium]|nr:hypothetical protein [Legionellaceae bacterium]